MFSMEQWTFCQNCVTITHNKYLISLLLHIQFYFDCDQIIPHFDLWSEPVHVDMTIIVQLVREFRCQCAVGGWREISQGIAKSELKW